MTTFFGLCDSAGNATGAASDNNGGAAVDVWNNIAVQTFTCPGSGSQTVVEISADVHTSSGSPVVRCGIYSSDGTSRIAQGSATVTVTGASDSWQGHIGQANITPNPATLTGGTNYVLFVCAAGVGTTNTDHGSATANSMKFDNTDDSGGLPASLPAGTIASPLWPVRVGLADSAFPGLLSIPLTFIIV